MSSSVIVVRTANRPGILDRCITAAVDGCAVAREAHWIVLDDSSPHDHPFSQQVAQSWKRFGLQLSYIDKTIEDKIANSLSPMFRNHFAELAARPSSCRAEGGRNLGLILGLALNPNLLFFIDDDMVHRHDGNCFFHRCANIDGEDGFVAAPRKRGISDMAYLRRLSLVLKRSDWIQFVGRTEISADPDVWYSPSNPLWKRDEAAAETPGARDVVSGQLMALHNKGVDWLPFPSEYNSDVNWSFLQSSFQGTELLKLTGSNVQHLPPGIPHSKAQTVFSEMLGVAITRSLRQVKRCGAPSINTLAERLPLILGSEIKKELLLFLGVEHSVGSRKLASTGKIDREGILFDIAGALGDVAKRLASVDAGQFAVAWTVDFAMRRRIFSELRQNNAVQVQICSALRAIA